MISENQDVFNGDNAAALSGHPSATFPVAEERFGVGFSS